MRICLLTKEYPPDTGWGGIGAYNYQIAQGLKEIGHDVEVVALAAREKLIANHGGYLKGGTSEHQEGILVHRIPWNGSLTELGPMRITMPTSNFVIKTNMSLWHRFLEVHSLNPFDVVETPEHLAEGLLPAISAAVPLVLKLHTPYSKFIAEKFHNVSPAFDHQFIAMLERTSMLMADLLISPSQDLAKFVADDLNYPLDRIQLIQNPVDANRFTPEGPQALPSDGRLTVLFAGRLEERKGVHLLIAAIPEIIKSFSKVRFVVIGSDTNTATGQQPVLPLLKTKLKESGHLDKVTFINQVALSEMPAYYRSADICIAPSLYDNAPYTCIEAMSTGKAFIGTTAGGMKEYIQDGHSGIIVPAGNVEAIAASVIRLLTNESERLSMGYEARKYILDHVHRTQIAKDNIEAYKLAIANHKLKSSHRNYTTDAQHSFDQLSKFIYLHHLNLTDLLYQQSILYRIRHWFKLFTSRPRLFLSRIFLQLSQRLPVTSPSMQASLNELTQRIKLAEQEREDSDKERLGYPTSKIPAK